MTALGKSRPGSGRHAAKVRTGCLTCKRRRVKCDELKPHCERCQKAGLTCAGYKSTKSWTFVPASFCDIACGESRSSSGSTGSSSEDDDVHDKLTLIYNPDCDRSGPATTYLTSTAPFISVRSEPHFWTVLLPQFSMYSESLRHALTSLSSLQLPTVQQLPIPPNHTSMRHYGLAIQNLTKTRPTVDNVLITGIILALVDLFNGSLSALDRHVTSSIRLARQWQLQQSSLRDPWSTTTLPSPHPLQSTSTPSQANELIQSYIIPLLQTERTCHLDCFNASKDPEYYAAIPPFALPFPLSYANLSLKPQRVPSLALYYGRLARRMVEFPEARMGGGGGVMA